MYVTVPSQTSPIRALAYHLRPDPKELHDLDLYVISVQVGKSALTIHFRELEELKRVIRDLYDQAENMKE